MNVDFTLASHTNVGKTSLMRTLLRRDIGEVADRPHVTDAAERHVLVESADGHVLALWDTPGFGDSVRLLKRLQASGNPVGWILTQVWDRFVDRPFFCSQQAVKAVRESSDLVLYLVNAAEDEAASAYVEAELEILRWIGKPVLLLLNQVGRPREADAARGEEERWQRRLAAYVPAGATLTLDAFARCWVQEDRLLELADGLLAGDKRAAFRSLRAAWRERNLAVFRDSMALLAATLAESARDREPLPEVRFKASLLSAARRIAGKDEELDAPTREALERVARRLQDRERQAADRLIALHGLAGNARERILSGLASAIDIAKPVDVAASGALGGLVGGALTGLAADAASGGLTLGLGALIGGIVGALGAGSFVHAYNESMGLNEGGVRWLPAMLSARAGALLLLYLAVAHHGRARGPWAERDWPLHWARLVDEALASRARGLETLWERARDDPASATDELRGELEAAARTVLVRLYPEARDLLGAAPVANILFLCTHNSARSILAEAIANHLGKGRFRAFSAGSYPKPAPNPLALRTLEALRVPADGLRSKSWDEFAAPGAPVMDFIVTVCDDAAGEACPAWPGKPATAHWGVADPSQFAGSEEERLRRFHETALILRRRIERLMQLPIEKLDRVALQRSLEDIGRS